VLYRMSPKQSQCVDRVGAAGRVRYSGLKEAAPGEAIMRMQWCWGLGEKLGEQLLKPARARPGLVW
jgi:hypothetical protein